jgi:hypothetical protein
VLADGHTYAFARTLNGASVVVAVNAGTAAQGVPLPLSAAGDQPPAVLYADPGATLSESDRVLELPARSGMVLAVASPVER